MKHLLLILGFSVSFQLFAQKRVYDVFLFGKKIGKTEVERLEKSEETVEYHLDSKSEMNIFFSRKSSQTNYQVIYKHGKLFSSFYKDVKDDAVEIVSIFKEGGRYMIKKGEELLEFHDPVHFSAMSLYFTEPVHTNHFFSERLGRFVRIHKKSDGVYECQLEKGVSATYFYKDGLLTELQMSKGVSVVMKLVM